LANGLLDAKRDRLMLRLAVRSQALELVGEKAVVIVASLAMLVSLLLAVQYLSWLTAVLVGVSIVAYLGLYTAWLKRTSPLALLVGAIPGALPPLIGAAAAGSISTAALLLVASIYLWQLPHFSFLALQYQDQYRLAGVPVFPVAFGRQRTCYLIVLSSTSLIPVLCSFWLLGAVSLFCALILLVAGIAWLAGNLWAVQQQSRYRYGFLASLVYLVVVLVALMLDVIIRTI
jgi:protoheme IX farnesyltransferase